MKSFKNCFFYDGFLKNLKDKALNFLLVKNVNKDFSCIESNTDHTFQNYGSSNLLFRFTDSCACYPKKKITIKLWVLIFKPKVKLTLCYYHVTYEFQIESIPCSLSECQGTPCSKQAPYLKFKWQQRDSNTQALSS